MGAGATVGTSAWAEEKKEASGEGERRARAAGGGGDAKQKGASGEGERGARAVATGAAKLSDAVGCLVIGALRDFFFACCFSARTAAHNNVKSRGGNLNIVCSSASGALRFESSLLSTSSSMSSSA